MYFQELFLSEAYLKKGPGTRDREPKNQGTKNQDPKKLTPLKPGLLKQVFENGYITVFRSWRDTCCIHFNMAFYENKHEENKIKTSHIENAFDKKLIHK